MKYRSYKEAMQAVQDIEFTSQGRFKSKSDFASKARYWSESTFKKRLGQARRNQERREIRRKLIEKGFTRKQADRLKGRKKEFLKSLLEKDFRDGIKVYPPKKKDRKTLWQEWARAQNFPQWVVDKAQQLNVERGAILQKELGLDKLGGFDINDSFGYAVVFEAFMMGEPMEMFDDTLEEVLKYTTADPHDGNIYLIDKSKLRKR